MIFRLFIDICQLRLNDHFRLFQYSMVVVPLGHVTVFTQFLDECCKMLLRYRFNQYMYWTNFRQPTAHVQQNIFVKTLVEACSLHLYASFGTFCIQIGQLFAPQWVFKHTEEFRNRRNFPSKTANCRFSNIL